MMQVQGQVMTHQEVQGRSRCRCRCKYKYRHTPDLSSVMLGSLLQMVYWQLLLLTSVVR